MAGETPDQEVDLTNAIRGILALLAAERDERLDDRLSSRRTEVVLASAGLTFSQMGSILGKKPDTVRKAVERSRKR